MKNYITMLFIVGFSTIGMTQSITLNACHPLIENGDYMFNQTGIDVTNRNIFETSPVNDESPCGGIGNCEFRIAWNDGVSRWEIFADDGNGTFVNTYVLYYNTEASLPNPPSLSLGTWEENTTITASLCGAINSLTGDVQDMTLGVLDVEFDNDIQVYPNPTSDIINIKSGIANIQKVEFFDINGKVILTKNNVNQPINLSPFNSGIYFAKISSDDKIVVRKIIIE